MEGTYRDGRQRMVQPKEQRRAGCQVEEGRVFMPPEKGVPGGTLCGWGELAMFHCTLRLQVDATIHSSTSTQAALASNPHSATY